MFKCGNCENVFEDVKTEREPLGYYGECIAWGEYGVCPYCKAEEFEEAVKCAKCGEWFLRDELVSGVCEECGKNALAEYKYDPVAVYNISKECEDETEITINGFLASEFTVSEIEDILLRELINSKGLDFSSYLNDDKNASLDVILEMEAKK